MKKILIMICVLLLLAVSCSTTGQVNANVANKAQIEEPKVADSWKTLKSMISSSKKTAEIIIGADLVADSSVGTITIPAGRVITLKEDGAAKNIARGTLKTELFYVEEGAQLTIEGDFIIDGESVTTQTAGITSLGDFTADDVIFKNFVNEVEGGAVTIALGTGTFSDCRFENNTAKAGAAINTVTKTGGYLIVDDCEFVNNTATLNGAAINALDKTMLVLSDSLFEGNKTTATGKNKGGAALYMAVTNSEIKECIFKDNHVVGTTDGSLTGGAILFYCVGNNNTYNDVIDCTFIGNGGVDFGGAIGIGDNGKERTKDGKITVTNCTFENNNAVNGTALAARFDLFTLSVDVAVSACTFKNDNAYFVSKNALSWKENNIEPSFK